MRYKADSLQKNGDNFSLHDQEVFAEVKGVKAAVHKELQKYGREEQTGHRSSTSPHRIHIVAEGYKSANYLKDRLPWDVKVVSLTDRHLSDLNMTYI